jgi:hypothetical protein
MKLTNRRHGFAAAPPGSPQAGDGTGWFARAAAGVLIVGAALFGAAPVHAQTAGTGVSYTLEGCRNDGTIVLPINGQYVCPDSAYTTGNLGKGWNELDLVPYRLTVETGNSAPATQQFTVAVLLDKKDSGKFGYDILSELTLNTALSDAGCTAPTGQPLSGTTNFGGIDESLVRQVSLQQAKQKTCVYDYYGRLALGSHEFPGSSLHANLANSSFQPAGVGSKEVSIPVKEIQPQTIDKTMTASQDASHAWNVSKSGPANVSFGDVCRNDAEFTAPVQITVTWERVAATPGSLTILTNIYATNPASRTITVDVTDVVYKGTTQVDQLGTHNTGAIDVPANSTMALLGTFTLTLPNSGLAVGDWVNDVATATYTDKATGVPVPGTTSVAKSAQITAGATSNTTAYVTDAESITGDGLTFSAAAPSVGQYVGYTAGTPTTGPVDWAAMNQTGSGSVTFNKTLILDGRRITSGTLSDQAKVYPSNGGEVLSNLLNVGITSTASVALTIEKSIPAYLDTGEKIEVTFTVTRGADPSYSQDVTLTFQGGGAATQSTTLTGLVPDQYTVEEKSATFFPADYPATPSSASGLVPDGGSQKSVDLTLSVVNGVPVAHCAGTATFVNRPGTTLAATAQVQKITFPSLTNGDPDYAWTFTLTGPGGTNEQKVANAGAGFVGFGVPLAEGTYTVTETQKSGWDLTSATPNDGTATTLCRFTVDYPEDQGKTFSCTFTNTKRGLAQVVKTVNGSAPASGQAFTFQLRSGATTVAAGTTLETLVASSANGGTLNFTTKLVPGTTYQMCEVVMPGWTTTLGTFVPESFNPPDGIAANPNVDNSILCGNFTVEPGETEVFTIDNSPPPGGRALTIGFWKNHASCRKSNGNQQPVMDQVLATFPNGGVLIGDLFVDTCAEAVQLLDKSTLSGKKMASDPGFNLAAQLLAARLNVHAGAGVCPAAVTAINAAQALLDAVGFNGIVKFSGSASQASQANSLAATLDAYNNNHLCSSGP